MKLTKESIKHNVAWKGYRLPQYDIDAVRENTHKAPTWLHFGAGNLFRAFPAVLAQRLLTAGLSDTGIICCDGYDEGADRPLLPRLRSSVAGCHPVFQRHDQQGKWLRPLPKASS